MSFSKLNIAPILGPRYYKLQVYAVNGFAYSLNTSNATTAMLPQKMSYSSTKNF